MSMSLMLASTRSSDEYKGNSISNSFSEIFNNSFIASGD